MLFPFLLPRLAAAALSLVPKRRYETKLAAIKSRAQKAPALSDGWRYCTAASELAGTHCYYHHRGPGGSAPKVLFLHGLTLDGRNFLPLAPLARQFELYAYDFPETSEQYTGSIDDFARLVGDFVDVMGLDRVFLVGVSFGGMVALRLCAQPFGQKVVKVALISTKAAGLTPRDVRQAQSMGELVRRLEDHQLYWLVDWMMRRFVSRLSPAEKQKMEPIVRVKRPEFFRQIAGAVKDYRAVVDCQKTLQPALVIQGTADTIIAEPMARKLASLLKNARYEPIQGATHAVAFLQSQEVAELLESFFLSS